jgi:TolA-binding protein
MFHARLARLACWTAFVALFAVVVPTAQAQDAQEKYDFAKSLGENGFYEIAQEIYQEIKNDGSASDEQKALATLGEALLKSFEVDSTGDPERKLELADTAITQLEEFLSSFPTHPKAADAKFNIGDLYRMKGDAAKRKANLPDVEDPASIMSEAQGYYGQSADYFKSLLGQFEANSSEDMLSRYNYLIAVFNHAESYEEGSSEGIAKYGDFLKAATDFMWSWEGWPAAFDIAVYMGRAKGFQARASQVGSDKEKLYIEADQWFDYSWNMTTWDEGKVPPLFNIPLNSVRHRMIMLRGRALDYPDQKEDLLNQGLAKIDEALKLMPQAPLQGIGGLLEIEKAYTYAAMDDTGKAINLLSTLQEKGGPIKYEAQRALEKLTDTGVELNAQVIFGIAEAKYRQGKFDDAIEQYTKVLEKVVGTADEKEYKGKCTYQIAMCHKWKGDAQDAFDKFTAAEQELPAEKAADAAYQLILTAQDIYRSAEEDMKDQMEEQYKAALGHFNSTYPSDPRTADTQYIQARMLMSKEQYPEAATAFEGVGQDSSTYEKALYYAGYCSYKAGLAMKEPALAETDVVFQREKLQEVIRVFTAVANNLEAYEKWINENKDAEEGNAELGSERRMNIMASRFYVAKSHQIISDMYAAMAEAADLDDEKMQYEQESASALGLVIPALEGFEDDFADEARRVAIILDMKIDTHMKLGKLNPETLQENVSKAQEILEVLLGKYGDQTEYMTRALSNVGEQLHIRSVELAEEAETLEDPEAKKTMLEESYQIMRQAADYFRLWVDKSGEPKALNLDTIGNMLFEVAEKENSRDYYEYAIAMYEQVMAKYARVDQAEMTKAEKISDMSVAEYIAHHGLKEIDRSKLDLKRAKCYAKLHKWDLAVVIYRDEIIPKNQDNAVAVEEYGEMLINWGDQLKTIGKQKEAIERWSEARKNFGTLILKVKSETHPVPHWNAQQQYILLMGKLGEEKKAISYIESQIEFKYERDSLPEEVIDDWDAIMKLKEEYKAKTGEEENN